MTETYSWITREKFNASVALVDKGKTSWDLIQMKNASALAAGEGQEDGQKSPRLNYAQLGVKLFGDVTGLSKDVAWLAVGTYLARKVREKKILRVNMPGGVMLTVVTQVPKDWDVAESIERTLEVEGKDVKSPVVTLKVLNALLAGHLQKAYASNLLAYSTKVSEKRLKLKEAGKPEILAPEDLKDATLLMPSILAATGIHQYFSQGFTNVAPSHPTNLKISGTDVLFDTRGVKPEVVAEFASNVGTALPGCERSSASASPLPSLVAIMGQGIRPGSKFNQDAVQGAITEIVTRWGQESTTATQDWPTHFENASRLLNIAGQCRSKKVVQELTPDLKRSLRLALEMAKG